MHRSFSLKISALFMTMILALAIVSVAPILAQTSQADTKAPAELKNFDNMVPQSRQEMRKYCAIVQELIKQEASQKQAKGLEHIRQSLALREKVQQKFQS